LSVDIWGGSDSQPHIERKRKKIHGGRRVAIRPPKGKCLDRRKESSNWQISTITTGKKSSRKVPRGFPAGKWTRFLLARDWLYLGLREGEIVAVKRVPFYLMREENDSVRGKRIGGFI